ncbi:MAG: FUSC family protein [Acidobacteriaceae bacterium]|nr:FUSC family protein [Acidobacteriaceae bacterium]
MSDRRAAGSKFDPNRRETLRRQQWRKSETKEEKSHRLVVLPRWAIVSVNDQPTAMATTRLHAFWRTITRLDKSRINSIWRATRNGLAVALPLSIGIALDSPLAAVAIATGALNVAYSDGRDPYGQRARRMLLWSGLGALAVFVGSITGQYHVAAVLVSAAWALAAGLLVSVSSRAGDLGLNTLVTVIVFAARGPALPEGAVEAGLLAFAGGLLQIAFALLFWPVRRYAPEREAIAQAYLDLSKELDPRSGTLASIPLTPQSSQVEDTLSALGRDHSTEGERLRMLFDQADRLRLSAYLVNRVRSELAQDQRRDDGDEHTSPDRLEHLLDIASKLLNCVGRTLLSQAPSDEGQRWSGELAALVDEIQAKKGDSRAPLANDIASAVDVLAGQLRVVVQLANNATPQGLEEFAKREEESPSKLQLRGVLATLGANLDMGSAACRHAIRLAAAVAMGDAIARNVGWQRNYWLPMTIAVVLKPDFTTTFSRGVLRLCGTLGGLMLATVLYRALPYSATTQLLLVGVYTFFLRWLGPANYGIFSVAISGLIVFLIAVTGVPPGEVVFERAINTIAGGVFALIAYAVWPTWEHKQVPDVLAEMLDACREYFHVVVERFSRHDAYEAAELERTRSAWRRARSNAEASVDRVEAEPGFSREKLELLTSILASSNSLAHSLMALEARVIRTSTHSAPEAFRAFARDVEFTVYFLAAALRGSQAANETLPKLREAYRHLLDARAEFSPADQFVLIETDRLTVSLNTLREQVQRYLT